MRCRLRSLTLRLLSLPFAILALSWSLNMADAATPTLRVEPERGPCAVINPPIVVRGSGFSAGIAIDVTSRRTDAPLGQPRGTTGRTMTGADGTFTVQGILGGCAPQVPDGTQFTIEAVDPTPPVGGGYLTVLASATFIKGAAAPTVPGLPNTLLRVGLVIMVSS